MAISCSQDQQVNFDASRDFAAISANCMTADPKPTVVFILEPLMAVVPSMAICISGSAISNSTSSSSVSASATATASTLAASPALRLLSPLGPALLRFGLCLGNIKGERRRLLVSQPLAALGV
ncbi:hypothetical protein FISHEDRAFT_76566 [Fistulina hepatica ATCC 64428]|uniref:Uncharacterized protein n=1 Tax=Fistulina hepatica ATCC 64428 TaxID=1128425 RepID=A0A0D7A656_9AGAR|nr:hypothetical protein FISHEDRAFT_76566 [Fistulina hepatica ATCC 64428]